MRIASYAGESAGRGENFGEAIARSRMAGLPPILVRDAQWTLDLEGLVNLMLNAGVEVTTHRQDAFMTASAGLMRARRSAGR